MKTTINLLPRQIQKGFASLLGEKPLFKILPFLLLVVFLFLSHILIKHSIAKIRTETARLTDKKALLEKEFSQLSAQMAVVENFKKEVEQYRHKLNILENLFTGGGNITEILRTLSHIAPPGLWLKVLELKKNPNNMIIEGWALSHSDIVSFIAALEKSQHFSNVGLEESRKSSVEERTVIEFKLSAQLNL